MWRLLINTMGKWINYVDDDDLVLIEDGITDNSIEKIKTICSRVDRKRAPLKNDCALDYSISLESRRILICITR